MRFPYRSCKHRSKALRGGSQWKKARTGHRTVEMRMTKAGVVWCLGFPCWRPCCAANTGDLAFEARIVVGFVFRQNFAM